MSPSPEHVEYAQVLLVEKVQAAGIRVPSELEELAWLTPWAATLRYDEPLPLDRSAALTLAERTCAWAKDRLPGA